MDIVIAFHIPVNIAPVKALDFLDHLFKQTFEDQASRIDLGNEITNEVMYAVHKPLIATSPMLEEFFKKLETIFVSSIEYIPHFTQPPKELLKKEYLNV